jgi:hypothetical protein
MLVPEGRTETPQLHPFMSGKRLTCDRTDIVLRQRRSEWIQDDDV